MLHWIISIITCSRAPLLAAGAKPGEARPPTGTGVGRHAPWLRGHLHTRQESAIIMVNGSNDDDDVMIMIAMMMMIISYLTWPVCPCGTPARGGGAASLVVVRVMGGTVRVTITPAEVPTHSMSLTARREVTRRHAVLCCRMISSQ